jgi:hypothetical protein
MELEQQGQLLTPEEVVDRIFLLVDENGDGKGCTLQGRDGHCAGCRATSHPLMSSSVNWLRSP